MPAPAAPVQGAVGGEQTDPVSKAKVSVLARRGSLCTATHAQTAQHGWSARPAERRTPSRSLTRQTGRFISLRRGCPPCNGNKRQYQQRRSRIKALLEARKEAGVHQYAVSAQHGAAWLCRLSSGLPDPHESWHETSKHG